MTWLNLLVSGTIFYFGIRHGIGADMISDFFQLLRLGKHVGVSTSSNIEVLGMNSLFKNICKIPQENAEIILLILSGRFPVTRNVARN